jgi:hemolysin III
MSSHLLPRHQFTATRPAHGEELANAITHGFGLALSVTGAVLMAAALLSHGDPWRTVGCSVYLASLVAVYATSTLSHSLTQPRWRSFFSALDQGFIYFLIAATYTPISLTYLRTGVWWLLLGAVWAVALYGFVTKVFFAHRVEAVSVWPYVVLGWLPILSVPKLLSIVDNNAGFLLMLVGGLCYTVGTVFLVCDQKVRHFHAIWHLFVIAGSTCHFLAILLFIANAG